jgi:hypothetical protein
MSIFILLSLRIDAAFIRFEFKFEIVCRERFPLFLIAPSNYFPNIIIYKKQLHSKLSLVVSHDHSHISLRVLQPVHYSTVIIIYNLVLYTKRLSFLWHCANVKYPSIYVYRFPLKPLFLENFPVYINVEISSSDMDVGTKSR